MASILLSRIVPSGNLYGLAHAHRLAFIETLNHRSRYNELFSLPQLTMYKLKTIANSYCRNLQSYRISETFIFSVSLKEDEKFTLRLHYA